MEFARAQTDEVTIRLFLLPSLTLYFQFIRVQILQIAVNGRKNSLILRVLGELCSGDQMRAKCLLEKAVLLVTLNDDHETLEEILNWAVAEGFSLRCKAEECVDVDQHCPVLLACHENYTKCITVLYKFGYRVLLPDKDKTTINRVLETDDAVINDWYFYYTLYRGNGDIRYRAGIKLKAGKIETGDPIERFLKFKAVANPHYILTEFLENTSNDPVEFRQFDPIRRSLALARYSKHLSSYNVPYSQEYKEISKVGRPLSMYFYYYFVFRNVRSWRPPCWITVTRWRK